MGKQAIDAPRGASTFKGDPDALIIIGLDTEDGPEHPLWDKRAKKAVNMGLVHDIMDQGILEPVLVRRNGSATEVVAGRQRVKAARKANELLLEKAAKTETDAVLVIVPCLLRSGDAKALMKAAASENANRENLDALEEAQAMQRTMDVGQMTEEEVATAFGCNKQTVKNRLALNSVCADVKDAIREGTIPATAAMKLAPLSVEDQKVALEELITEGNTSVDAAARTVRTKKNKKRGAATETDGYPRPGVRLLRKIIEHETAKEAIDKNALQAIRWMLGDTPPSSVKGLSALIANIEELAE